jgi:fatty-acyl-CoA synthase
MSAFGAPLRSLADIARFEREMPLSQRFPAGSVYDIFSGGAARHGERTALTFLATGADDEVPRVVSYRALAEGITRAANLFARLAGPGAGVAYLLPSLVETHFVLWGAETAGVAVPINFLLQPQNIADLVTAAGARVLVALGAHPQLDIWAKARAVKALLPDLVLVRVGPGGDGDPDGTIDFAAALAAEPGDSLRFGAPRGGDDVAAYFHTGGTTGLPKLVTHTHRNQLAAAFGGTVMQDLDAGDVIANGLPMFHVAATISCGLSFFIAGASLLMLSPGGMRNPAVVANYWRIVARHRATVIGGVPTALAALVNVPVDADLSAVRYSISGAASLPRALAERFEAVTGTRIHEILGMTEAGGLVALDPGAADPVTGSVGFRLPYSEVVVRRLDPDGGLGAPCAPGEVGVLTVAGPNVTPGYRDPSQNAALLRAGWLDSGDLAYADAEGRLFIAGRAKDLIIRSGHNIDPLMIEDALQAHPAVALAAAVGQPDRYAGELPVCYVTLKPGQRVGADELQRFAEPRIAERPAWPKAIWVVDSLPVTSVGKIFKPTLRHDAVRRLVEPAVRDAAGEAATVEVTAGGRRGTLVRVVLPPAAQHRHAAVAAALEGYLFDVEIATDA